MNVFEMPVTKEATWIEVREHYLGKESGLFCGYLSLSTLPQHTHCPYVFKVYAYGIDTRQHTYTHK